MIGVGVTLRLEKVQIIDFVAYSSGGGVDHDFEVVEGGYLHNQVGVDSDFAQYPSSPAPQEQSADLVV